MDDLLVGLIGDAIVMVMESRCFRITNETCHGVEVCQAIAKRGLLARLCFESIDEPISRG